MVYIPNLEDDIEYAKLKHSVDKHKELKKVWKECFLALMAASYPNEEAVVKCDAMVAAYEKRFYTTEGE